MINHSDNFFLQQKEPTRSCLLTLKEIILSQDTSVSSEWKYGMPFFCYNGKMFCYLWIKKDTGFPYLGIVDGKLINHPDLIMEKRSRMKIMLIHPSKKLKEKEITKILQEAISLRKFL